jgi:hypothetical protein
MSNSIIFNIFVQRLKLLSFNIYVIFVNLQCQWLGQNNSLESYAGSNKKRNTITSSAEFIQQSHCSLCFLYCSCKKYGLLTIKISNQNVCFLNVNLILLCGEQCRLLYYDCTKWRLSWLKMITSVGHFITEIVITLHRWQQQTTEHLNSNKLR